MGSLAPRDSWRLTIKPSKTVGRPNRAPLNPLWCCTRRAPIKRTSATQLAKTGRHGLIGSPTISGTLRIAQFDRPEKIRPVIRRWRNQWADKPRTADYGMQVLSRVLSYAVDPLGKVAGNPCEGLKRLYSGDRSEIIWTDSDLKRLKDGATKKPCPESIKNAVDLAAHTGLRLSDLLRLSWSHVGEDAITLASGRAAVCAKRLSRCMMTCVPCSRGFRSAHQRS